MALKQFPSLGLRSGSDSSESKWKLINPVVPMIIFLVLISSFPSSSSSNPTKESSPHEELISYMNQSLITPHLISTDIFDKYFSFKDVLVLSGLDSHKLNELLNAKIEDSSSTQQLEKKWVTSRFIVLDEPSHFQRICNKVSRTRPVHLLHYDDRLNVLKWIKSRNGRNFDLKEFVMKGREISEEPFFENLLNGNENVQNDQIDNQLICISGSSHLGNSIFMDKVGRRLAKANPTSSVIFLKAHEFINQTRELVETSMDMANAIQNVLQGQPLPTNETSNIKTELLLYNFDEVAAEYVAIAIEIMETIKSSFKSVRLWITTTSSEEVETKLEVLCYHLKPLTEEDQVGFLQRFWSRNQTAGDDDGKLKRFTRESLKALRDESNLNGNGTVLNDSYLQSLLLAEVYDAEAIDFSQNHEKENMIIPVNVTIHSITNLYESLINRNVLIHKSSDEKRLDKMDIQQSLDIIFPGKFDKLKKSFGGIEMDKIVKTGILGSSPDMSTGYSRLIKEKSIAEYFVARFVMDWLQTGSKYNVEEDEFSKFFLEGVLVTREVQLNQIPDVSHLKYKMHSFEFIYPTLVYFLNSFINAKDVPNLRMNSIHKFIMESPHFIQTLRQIAHASVNSGLLQLFTLFDELHIFMDDDKSKIFDEELLYLTIEKSDLEFIKTSITYFEQYHDFDLSMKAKALGLAVHRGNFSIVEFLIKEKQFGGMVEKVTRLLLHDCVIHTKYKTEQEIDNKIKVLHMLVGINRDLLEERVSWFERTPLLSEEIHIRLLTELIRLGADVLVQDKNNDTILHWSHNKRRRLSTEDYHTLVQAIPEDKLKILVGVIGGWDEDQQSPLSEFVRYVDPLPQTLKLFKKAGADFNFMGGELNYSIVANAIWHKRSMDPIMKLIECGADVMWRGNNSQTLLHIAGYYGNLEAMNLLMNEYGLDGNAKDGDGLTALDYVIKSEDINGRRVATGLALYENGVKFRNTVNSEGEAPLHVATKKDNSLSVQLLLMLGEVDVNVKDKLGNTPLHLWVTPGHSWVGDHLFITKLLLDMGADPNLLNNEGETPFQSALENGDLDFETFQLLKSSESVPMKMNATLATDALEVLIQKGTDLSDEEFAVIAGEFGATGAEFNYRDYFGSSLLHAAARHGNYRAVRFLVGRKGADVNSTNKGMETPLHSAAKGHSKDSALTIIKYLIDNGANVLAKDDRGATFLKIFVSHIPQPSPSQFHSLTEYLVLENKSELFKDVGGQNVTLCELVLQELKPYRKTLRLLQDPKCALK